MRKHIWLLPALLFLYNGVSAQPTKLYKANQYFEEGNYRQAIPLFEEALGREDLPEAKIRLAESYRFLGNYKASAQWYALVIGLPDSRPEDKFYYGLMLLRTGDCKAAERWFKDYLKYHPYDPRRQRLLNACGYIKELSREEPGRVALSLPAFNSLNSELGPAYYGDGLVFSAFRRSEEEPTQAFLDLFLVTASGTGATREYAAPQLFSGSIRSKFHEGLAAFNSEETEIYLTRTRRVPSYSPLDAEIQRLEIVTARRLPQGGWSNLKPLPFSSDDYSIVHPSLSSDGQRLFFSSDMPGGQGGKDLYLSFLENGRWGPPINLGPSVNTPDDEVFPFISESGKLYFSSNGHLGLGGQDLFWTEEGYDGLWVLPYNLGAPFNSEADDFGIIFNAAQSEGYFTSNRSGGVGKDDIYYFQMAQKATPVLVDVLDITTSDPISYARVVNSCNGDTIVADRGGRLLLYLSDCCSLTGMADGYQNRSMKTCERKGELATDTLFIALALTPGQNVAAAPSSQTAPASPKAAVVPPRKAARDQPAAPAGTTETYLLSGTVFNQETNKPVYQAKIKLATHDCLPHPEFFTDRKGRFTIPLEEACCYKVRVERDNYFATELKKVVCAGNENYEQFFNIPLTPYADDPESEGDGEVIPVKMDMEADAGNFAFSRSDESEGADFAFRMNVYYDVGRSSVQRSSVPELLRLQQLMEENPDIILEISSHTDSNGDSESNQALSQRRADAIVRYLVKSGIEAERLQAKGYGESQLANDCADDVPCTQQQHQQNRRTEFRVMGKIQ